MPIWPNISKWQWVLILGISYPFWFLESFYHFYRWSPVHLIILNLVYDLSCIALPFDKVDKDFLRNPHIWEAKSITRFIGLDGAYLFCLWYFDLYFALFYHCTHDNRSSLCSWGRVCRRIYLSCFRQVGLSSPCGHRPWLSICCVQPKFPFYKVVQLG